MIDSILTNLLKLVSIILLLVASCKPENIQQPMSSPLVTTPLSPEQSLKLFHLPEGYHIELVASEPLVKDPVALAWDPNGDMYVAQMNTFMLDLHATDQHKPFSQVKKLLDTNADGIMDKSIVFADSLLLPRLILPIGNEILIQLTDTQHIFAYRDTNDDGRADSRRIIFENNTIDHRNMEHQNGGLLWNLDNWIYPTRDNLRYKFKNGKLISDTLYDHMIGQWGLTTDNYGRLYFSEAGPGLPAIQFQQMPKYGSLNFSDQYEDSFTIPFPVISTIDANGGEFALDSVSKKLKRFTSGCGQSIYRGDKFPLEAREDYFIAEPVARIIKRGKIISSNGKKIIKNAYSDRDWLASSDFNFRPVNTYTGPDGCFYIVDMYRGIIQEGEFAQDESYLSKIIRRLGLEKNKGYGRIYRVWYEGFKPDTTRPNLLSKSNSDLIKFLNHPNGWWRDMAQQLLITRKAIDAIPELNNIILSASSTVLQKIHSIWVLEGLDTLNDEILISALHDKSAEVRKTAIWSSEQKLANDNKTILDQLFSLISDPDDEVKTQVYLSLRTYAKSKSAQALEDLVKKEKNNSVIQYSHKVYNENITRIENEKKSLVHLNTSEKQLLKNGENIFQSFCATCHGKDGKGIINGNAPRPAPPLAGSPRVTGDKIMAIQILLHGLSGKLDGIEYPSPMLPQRNNTDEYIAAVLSYLRTNKSMGHSASFINAREVEDIRLTSPLPENIPDLRMYEIFKLGRSEAQNWDAGKPGSNGYKWGGRFLTDQERDSLRKIKK